MNTDYGWVGIDTFRPSSSIGGKSSNVGRRIWAGSPGAGIPSQRGEVRGTDW